MFGRRRPIVGAAVVVAASRSAAKREVERQAQQNALAQQAIAMEAERKRREEAERDARTKAAIDEALERERARLPQETQRPATPNACHEKTSETVGFCATCGQPRKRQDRFCNRCGSQLPELDAGYQAPRSTMTEQEAKIPRDYPPAY